MRSTSRSWRSSCSRTATRRAAMSSFTKRPRNPRCRSDTTENSGTAIRLQRSAVRAIDRVDLHKLDRLEIQHYRLYLVIGQLLDDAVHHRRIAQGILNHQKL